MAFDTRRHRFMPMIAIDVFKECGMTGHAITRTSQQWQQREQKENDKFHNAHYTT